MNQIIEGRSGQPQDPIHVAVSAERQRCLRICIGMLQYYRGDLDESKPHGDRLRALIRVEMIEAVFNAISNSERAG